MTNNKVTHRLVNNAFTKAILVIMMGIMMTSMAVVSPQDGWDIDNPYQQVNWEHHQQYKASLHVHTTRSDGRLSPHEVVDRYHELGFHILALTDHNLLTYPWTEFSDMNPHQGWFDRLLRRNRDSAYEDRDPEALGMIDIQANELSSHHHMGSFFNAHIRNVYGEPDPETVTEEESIGAVKQKDGIIMLYHPGRYDMTLQWYVDTYNNNDHVFGMEIYNQGDRYPGDRRLWDAVLTATMPARPVWGYSNDDMHGASHLGRNWNVLILPELTHEATRKGLEQGLSYYIYSPEGHDAKGIPVIENIEVNSNEGTISIAATNYKRVIWISKGQVIHEGTTIDLDELPQAGNYVRAELHGAGRVIAGTQPFGISRLDD
ncbi:MAG: hypothetical protein R6U64_06070 [Bacteroidales bacterium]